MSNIPVFHSGAGLKTPTTRKTNVYLVAKNPAVLPGKSARKLIAKIKTRFNASIFLFWRCLLLIYAAILIPAMSRITILRKKYVAQIQADIGAINVLVNNAGITRDMSFKNMDKPNWDAVMRTNLDSVFKLTKPVCDGSSRKFFRSITLNERNHDVRHSTRNPDCRYGIRCTGISRLHLGR
jgi:short chain dehydrogenase